MKIAGNKLIVECTAYDFKVELEKDEPESWLKSISAFADGDGGALYFGVNNNQEVVGLKNPQQTADDISRLINLHMDPVPVFTLIPDQTEDGKVVLELKVAAGNQTPYYVVWKKRRIAYIRNGNESNAANSHQLFNLVLKGSNRSWDSLVTNQSREKHSFTKLEAKYNERSGGVWDEGLLLSFGLVTEDNKLTNAGLLFSDSCPIKHSRLFCTRWSGLTKGYAINDNEYSGNILDLLEYAKNFIKVNTAVRWYPLPSYRLNFPEYAERAVEEMCVNHLIHRDYTEIGSEVAINIYDDRIETTSPGGIMLTDKFETVDPAKTHSKRRNPIIAEVFSQLKFMEKRGSGLRRIREWTAILPSYKEDKMPFYESNYGAFFTTLLNVNYGMTDQDFDAICDSKLEPGQWNGPRQNISPETYPEGEKPTQTTYPDKGQPTQTTYPEDAKPTQKNVGRTAQAVIDTLIANPNASRTEIAKQIGKSEDTVKLHLKNLQAKGIIKRIGPDFGGYWKVLIRK